MVDEPHRQSIDSTLTAWYLYCMKPIIHHSWMLPENYRLFLQIPTKVAQRRRGDLKKQRRDQTSVTQWLKRHRPEYQCRVMREGESFLIWIEKRKMLGEGK